MFFAYVDESGEPGSGGSQTYAFGVVLVEASQWSSTFDDLINFRRFLRHAFGIPVRAELKANYLLRNGGGLRALSLSESARFAVYRQHMRLQEKLGLRAFAVVIHKDRTAQRYPGGDPRDVAWETLLQRIERFTSKNNTQVLLVHDEGDAARVASWLESRGEPGRREAHLGPVFSIGQRLGCSTTRYRATPRSPTSFSWPPPSAESSPPRLGGFRSFRPRCGMN